MTAKFSKSSQLYPLFPQLFLGLNMIKLGKEKGKNVQEIDFLLINWTHQYILNIEVKKWLGVVKGKSGDIDKCSISKAKNQINTIKTMIEDWFGADLKGDWQYVSALYCQEMEESISVRLLKY